MPNNDGPALVVTGRFTYILEMDITLLQETLAQPTAPFREMHVIRKIAARLSENGVPHFQDPVGNLVVGVGSVSDYRKRLHLKSAEPLRLFIAHMDHPGFHGVRYRSPRDLEIQWFGGSPVKHLAGASVWLADSSGWMGEGTLRQPVLLPNHGALHKARVCLRRAWGEKVVPATSLFGGFAFRSPVWKEGSLIYTKAADDLVGAFVITTLALELQRRSEEKNFVGLLTRAEEVGFVGAIGHFDLGWMSKSRRPFVCVSLETSRTLPGAIIGKGPVVRLGDRATTFDAKALQLFTRLAREVLPEKHQRRIMDGGTCEATVATAYGYSAVGISVPLGNYHNQSFEGGPDSRGSLGPAPEFVHIDDIGGMLTLCRSLLKPGLPWQTPWTATVKEFKARKARYANLL